MTGMNGRIIRGVAGFYYVLADDAAVYECKARGSFRNEKLRPVVGDYVTISVTSPSDMEGSIDSVAPRKNELLRPLCANVDQALILFAVRNPEPSAILLDRMHLAMEMQNIPAAIAFNKSDLGSGPELAALAEIYRASGYPVHFLSIREGMGLSELMEILRGKTTVLCGPSGVGKSSLSNFLQKEVTMEVGEISKKLRRGKNTTRHAALLAVGEGTYLMDTPGFSAFEAGDLAPEDLRFYYPEFASYEGKCRYGGCLHDREPECAVRNAVQEGKIPEIRYGNYRTLLAELRDREKRRY